MREAFSAQRRGDLDFRHLRMLQAVHGLLQPPLKWNGLRYEVMATTTLEKWPEDSPGFTFRVDAVAENLVEVKAESDPPASPVFLRLRVSMD